MTDARILLIEDEPGVALTVGDRLRAEGYGVTLADSGEQGLTLALEPPGFDAVLLDVMLPGIDGFEVCRGLRRRGVRTPVLMLTARGEVHDRVRGLRLGADDYLAKPFDPVELLARVEALLRRARQPAQAAARVSFGEIEVDLRGLEVLRGGAPVELSAMEFQLLSYFVQHEGLVLSRSEILRDVWGLQRAPPTRTVDVHVTWLRGKLEPDRKAPRYIRTVRGVGYKFVGDGERAP